MNGYTKGPWHWEFNQMREVRGPISPTHIDNDPDYHAWIDCDVCLCAQGHDTPAYFDQPPEVANANLIAAAPELYEALEELVAAIQMIAPEAHCDPAVKALAKARGETL